MSRLSIVLLLLMELDPARTHEMTKTCWGLLEFYSQTKPVQKPYKSRKETTSVRQRSHPKQCITMPWHQGHSVISCMTITHHVWFLSCNRYTHTQSKHFVIFILQLQTMLTLFNVSQSQRVNLVCPSLAVTGLTQLSRTWDHWVKPHTG